MRHLRPSDYRVMPWRNGGGTTTEVAVFPGGSGLFAAPFLWRVSIAEVAADGPFSRFPGYDRHIMLLAGNGMRLDAGDFGVIDLTEPLAPRSFPGDWEITGRLTAGPVRDFNLMTNRERVRSRLYAARGANPTKLGIRDGTVVAYMIEGEALSEGRLLATDETVILEPGETLTVSALTGEIALAVAVIRLLQPASADD